MHSNNLYLVHYGVKGQRKGIRNYQNLDGSYKKGAEGRYYHYNKKGRKSANNTFNEYISKNIKAGKIRVDNLKDYNVGSLNEFVLNGYKYVSGLTHQHDFEWQEMINSIGRGLISVADDAAQNYKEYGHYGKYEFDETDSIFDRSVNHGRVDNFILRKCNPDYGFSGTTQNCAKCTATLELGKRGLYFSAGRQTYPSSIDAVTSWFKGAKRMEVDADVALDTIKSFGNKTSGQIAIGYARGGGHAMHFTVDDGGTFEIQDGQNGRRFSSIEEMGKTYGADLSKGISITRLDNCEIDWDALSSDSVVRNPGGDAEYTKVKNKFTGQVVDTW